ncbi:hypothetical protein [Cupriavidus nantongensis]|uniref:Uncharacterized protein n=1 Tax=Cupriavidus nantongensis TaxID=1796606 RepID=A0A142JNH0_9BURK|nr:hypothetical protein [Cupriavidus nantongensis]AMR79632.1 hypothetical protein A2G96_18810 [Cupriavidus nantongensis]
MSQPTILAIHFADEDFLKDNEYFVDRYVGLRVRGHSQHAAFRRVFGADNIDNYTQHRIDNLESTDFYNDKFDAAVKSTPVDQILNERIALVELMSVYRNPLMKETARLGALRDAMVLTGITEIDENGKTRKAGRALSDFYNTEGLVYPPAAPAAAPDPDAPKPPTLQ